MQQLEEIAHFVAQRPMVAETLGGNFDVKVRPSDSGKGLVFIVEPVRD